MKGNLFRAAKEYIDLVERIEKTRDPLKLQVLDLKKRELRLIGISLNCLKLRELNTKTENMQPGSLFELPMRNYESA